MRRTLFITSISILAIFATTLSADMTGADPYYSGAPGDGTCISCHGTTLNSGGGSVKVSFANGTTYVPGQRQLVTISIADPSAKRWGFEASPRLASATSTGAGTVATADSNTRIALTRGTLQWITHTQAGTRLGTTSGVTFQFNWTAPSTDVGDVTFYVAANAANGNSLADSGDHIYTTTATLTAAPVISNKPQISSGGVVNAANPASTSIEAGSWISIFGSNLAPSTIASGRAWEPSEIVNGTLPTSLDGVSVTVNGKAAAISYVSNGQINAQAPDDTATGPVSVVVTNANGASDPGTVVLQAFSPALFAFEAQSRRYAAAILADGSYSGPSGLFGTTPTVPARTGDILQLFATGFGPTTPTVASGQVFSSAASTANPVTATIGGVDAEVEFSGITGAGLYQINVWVPAGLSSGDQPIVLTVGGLATQSGLYVAVQ